MPQPVARDAGKSAVKLRKAQAQILAYAGGPLGVSAVPGSGKTLTLCLLAAQLIRRLAHADALDRQEVLIVTFSRSGVQNFRSRLDRLLPGVVGYPLLPGTGYSVRTLHSLAHEIVKQRPSLVHLSEDFAVLEGEAAARYQVDAARQVWRETPALLDTYYKPEIRRDDPALAAKLRDAAAQAAQSLMAEAAALRLDAGSARADDGARAPFPLLEFGLRAYARYQEIKQDLEVLDYDDLMRLAMDIVEQDGDLRTRLQEQWPFILEDEAQDSSRLQQALLSRLTERAGNWVRVGDPNQAINTTFTGSDSSLLQQFLERPDTVRRALPQSGRCAAEIMQYANALIDWSQQEKAGGRPWNGLVPPRIEPTAPDDPQPNPAGADMPVFVDTRLQEADRIDALTVRNVKRWLPNHPDQTVAVLAPDNRRARQVADALAAQAVAVDESLMRMTRHAAEQARKLARALHFVVKPQYSGLRALWKEVWVPLHRRRQSDADAERGASRWAQLEAHVQASWKESSVLEDWMEAKPAPLGHAPATREFPELDAFRQTLARWASSVVLPVDEILLLIGQDIFRNPEDMALTHRLALHLKDYGQRHVRGDLQACWSELNQVAQGRSSHRDLLGDASRYEARPGKVTVCTLHAAKGLEWDRVYILGLNDFAFPSDPDADEFMGAQYFVRDDLDLQAEGTCLLQLFAEDRLPAYREGAASRQARCDYIDERTRLLYVGITRARRALALFADTGRLGQSGPAKALIALKQRFGDAAVGADA